jgi:hypothetical protein
MAGSRPFAAEHPFAPEPVRSKAPRPIRRARNRAPLSAQVKMCMAAPRAPVYNLGGTVKQRLRPIAAGAFIFSTEKGESA